MIQDAMAFYQSGLWDAAKTQYRRLLRVLPSNTELLSNLGMMLLQKGLLEEGVKIFGYMLYGLVVLSGKF